MFYLLCSFSLSHTSVQFSKTFIAQISSVLPKRKLKYFLITLGYMTLEFLVIALCYVSHGGITLR